MDKETLASLEVIMAFAKRHGADDGNFEEFMAVSDWMRDVAEKPDDARLELEISDSILEVANAYPTATTSDLQGMSDVAARRIVGMVSNRQLRK